MCKSSELLQVGRRLLPPLLHCQCSLQSYRRVFTFDFKYFLCNHCLCCCDKEIGPRVVDITQAFTTKKYIKFHITVGNLTFLDLQKAAITSLLVYERQLAELEQLSGYFCSNSGNGDDKEGGNRVYNRARIEDGIGSSIVQYH